MNVDDQRCFNVDSMLMCFLGIEKLENVSKTLFQWFSDNQMKANPDKCHFLCSSNSEFTLTIENQKIKQ